MRDTNPNFNKPTDNQQPGQRLPLNRPLLKRLKRFNPGFLEPTIREKEIEKCKANIKYLKKSKCFTKNDVKLFTQFYENKLADHHKKIDEAHAYLIEVSSPKNSL